MTGAISENRDDFERAGPRCRCPWPDHHGPRRTGVFLPRVEEAEAELDEGERKVWPPADIETKAV